MVAIPMRCLTVSRGQGEGGNDGARSRGLIPVFKLSPQTAVFCAIYESAYSNIAINWSNVKPIRGIEWRFH
jgi:hypothetical protein